MSSCAASTSPCAGSGRCGTSRTARSPGARWRATSSPRPPGWHVVPPTVLRDGPFGPGMVQVWVDTTTSASCRRLARRRDVAAGLAAACCGPATAPASRRVLVHADLPELRAMAAFDVVVNNADRKGGHVLAGRRRRDLRGRPRAVPARRAQAAHGAVGLDRRPMTPEVLEPLRRLRAALDRVGAVRCATSSASTSRAARSARCGRVSTPCSEALLPRAERLRPRDPLAGLLTPRVVHSCTVSRAFVRGELSVPARRVVHFGTASCAFGTVSCASSWLRSRSPAGTGSPAT